MSWADDIRCLYCDGKLPLYRKLTNGQFCSAAHRKSYWQHQEALAIERLHQTHNSLRAWQPKPDVEPPPEIAIEPFEVPPMANTFASLLAPKADDCFRLIAADPFEYELVRAVETPSIGFPVFAENFPTADEVPAADLPLSYSAPVEAAVAELASFEGSIELVRHLPLEAAPATSDYAINEKSKSVERMLPVLPPAPRDCASAPAQAPVPEEITLRAHVAIERPVEIGSPALAVPAIVPMPSNRALDDAKGLIRIACLANLEGSVRVTRFLRPIPQREAKPRLAGGCRYAITLRRPANQVIASLELSRKQLEVTLPQFPSQRPESGFRSKCGVVRVPCPPKAVHQMNVVKAFLIPLPFTTVLMWPASRLEPLTATYNAEFPPAEVEATSSEAKPKENTSKLPEWAHVSGFWKHAPRDLKVLLFAIPLLLSLALHPSLPKVRVSAPTAGGLEKNVQHVWNTQMVSMRQSLTDRAGVELDEDFRSGLDDWTSRGQAATEWSFDATGFVQPTTLALYQPSLGLTDYQLQFLGMIDKKALSWVVRAADFNNYYVVKLVVLKGGPLPTIGVTRYAVIDGKAVSRADTIAPIDAREDTLYRIRLDVHDDTFALAVQGQMVDTWTDPQLKRGGIGFFCGKGEASRVRWVQLTHQYDMLGRLCAYLAPYNPSMNGSWQ